jgi:hypothetical protein
VAPVFSKTGIAALKKSGFSAHNARYRVTTLWKIYHPVTRFASGLSVFEHLLPVAAKASPHRPQKPSAKPNGRVPSGPGSSMPAKKVASRFPRFSYAPLYGETIVRRLRRLPVALAQITHAGLKPGVPRPLPDLIREPIAVVGSVVHPALSKN